MINSTIRATITTSQEQGQTREGMSGGSWRQSCELTDRNVIEGRDLWDELAQHNKILWFKGRGKWRSCAAKVHVLIRGDLPKGRSRDYGSLTEGHFERDGQPTEPYGYPGSAPSGNAGRDWAEVSRGHISQTPTVMGGTSVKGRTLKNREEPQSSTQR